MSKYVAIGLALAAVILAVPLIIAALALAVSGGGGDTGCDPGGSAVASVTAGGTPAYLIGDSIGLGVESDLSQRLDDKLTVQATGGIQLRESIPKLEGDKQKIRNAKSIVVELGTNHDANIEFKPLAKEMVKKIRDINPDATIYWVQIFTPGGITYPESNEVMRKLDGVQVIKTKDKGITLAPDKIHPDAAGYKKLAELIADAVKSGGSVSDSGGGDDGCAPGGDFSGECAASGLAFGLPSSNQADREAVFGKANSAAAKKSTTFFGKSLKIHEKVAPCLGAVEAEIKAKGLDNYKVRSIGGYHPRPGEPLHFFHMYGAAVDINPDTNPYCSCDTHDMPEAWAKVFEKYGFFWGGNFRTTKDWMHFEWHGEAP